MLNVTTGSLNARALTDDELRKMAPSIFTDVAAPETSSRYAHVSSAQVLNAMRDAGFLPVNAQQAKTRSDARRDFARHLIRFRHADTAASREVGEVVPEVVLLNAHDRTSAYRLFAGMFRLVCANGMIVADSVVGAIHINHVGQDVMAKVIEGSHSVLDGARKATEVQKRWSKVTLDEPRRLEFATRALMLRWPDEKAQPISAQALLRRRRAEDLGDDLWHTFNIVQENLVRGGLRGVSTTGSGRRTRTRAIGRISEDVRINRGLWELAEAVAA